ncbi:hypothetical protein BGY98DRAFT_972449 [Russula aff. rugulosa BPL654]|nr:hypothetical protein BGY98DRAFT_972449 [Russula aff. rugulosa BPL654]
MVPAVPVKPMPTRPSRYAKTFCSGAHKRGRPCNTTISCIRCAQEIDVTNIPSDPSNRFRHIYNMSIDCALGRRRRRILVASSFPDAHITLRRILGSTPLRQSPSPQSPGVYIHLSLSAPSLQYDM